MLLPLYQLDAFTTEPFSGNPAAVVPLKTWLPDAMLRSIAAENNLAETAYVLPLDATRGEFEIRWWTPTVEVPLCGHATLASAWVIFHRLAPALQTITFHSKGGILRVSRGEGDFTLDFPANSVEKVPHDERLSSALGGAPLEMHSGFQWLVVYESEREIRALSPDFRALADLGMHAVIVTAKGDTADFVSRFFAPNAGVDEDPVTGSAHTRLTPFWSARLGKTVLDARQVSPRGGSLRCELRGDRVLLTGSVVPYLEGTITIEP